MKAKLIVEVEFDGNRTDAESLAPVFDKLVETAMWNLYAEIEEEYGPVRVGKFTVVKEK